MSTARVLSIYSLANEVLVAIAAAALEDRILGETFKPEWTLSHVSGRFRAAIIGAPALWTLVEAKLDAEGSVEILKLYLERSGACSIWVALQHSTEQHNLVMEPLRLLVPHIHRIWRLRIEFSTTWEDQELDLAPLRKIAAPNLQHLEITRGIEPVYSEGAVCIELFSSGAPKLAFAQIHGFIPFPAPSWTASLTRLEFWGGHDAGDGVFQFASQSPLLVYLHLDIRIFPEGERFHLPSLKSFHITISDGMEADYLVEIFALFDTPALTEFTINRAHCDQICGLFNADSLLSSFPALTSLSFVNTDPCLCEEEEEFNTMSPPPFPALSSLTLINICFMQNIVDEILGPAAQPWSLLDTLTLCPKDDASPAVDVAVRDAVRARREDGLSLPRLRLAEGLMTALEEDEVDVEGMEMFDPQDVLDSFSMSWIES
ncbi:hypothetical protein B0H19DRAFT_1057559 [Mycena capillaripes]|nr:hypothetical protein B0H19DRAFT_1057559 [Mycena capillaripes]